MGEHQDQAQRAAATLAVSVGALFRRLKHFQPDGQVTMPESVALARLDRIGPMTSSELARLEQISPQSMGSTLAGLEARGLIRRTADPDDGRRVVLSLTPRGRSLLTSRRNARVVAMTKALSSGFTSDELDILLAASPLLERLATKI